MLSKETQIFIQLPHELAQRILHPARVTDLSEGICTVEVEETQLKIEAGQDLLIYYEMRNEFMKQPASVDGVMRGDDESDGAEQAREADSDRPLLVGLTLRGEPLSAESRLAYRVSTLIAELVADLGSEKSCPLQDVSATVFSVMATKSHAVGAVVKATLYFNDKQFSGSAYVQSIKDVGHGRFRYGLHSVDDKQSTGDLLKGLQQISMAIQREQLRRLRGTA